MAYAILCVEQYLKTKYPDKDWSRLSERMWPVTNMSWDEWAEEFMEIIPQYLFENDTYEESDFEFLEEADYEEFTGLFKDISDRLYDDEHDRVNYLLLSLYKLEEVYAYTEIPGNGEESLKIIDKMCEILTQEDVILPKIETVSFSSFTERNGWGNRFDGTGISLILNRLC